MKSGQSANSILRSVYLGVALAGICYVLVCGPVGLAVSEMNHQDTIAIFLFLDVGGDPTKYFKAGYSLVANDVPYLASLGFAYGLMCLLCLAIPLVFKENFAVKFITSANGIFIGYSLTQVVAEFYTDTPHISYQAHLARIFYLYFLYLTFVFLREYFPFTKPWRPQFDMFFDGLYGTISAIIVSAGFDTISVSIILGPAFLVFTFIGMVISENFVTRSFLTFLLSISQIEKKLAAERSRKRTQQNNLKVTNLFSLLFRTFTRNWVQPISKLHSSTRKLFRLVAIETSDIMGDRAFNIALLPTLSILTLMVLWPWVMIVMINLGSRLN